MGPLSVAVGGAFQVRWKLKVFPPAGAGGEELNACSLRCCFFFFCGDGLGLDAGLGVLEETSDISSDMECLRRREGVVGFPVFGVAGLDFPEYRP